ncbi:MAG: phosphoribosylformylglycinamidine cyclo-ligase [Candidatus Eisenbacteria bacterium]|nr:phosphoribosylformylglycinamidine cyclo-ligase [Candidatus Eisenbacteria bacterium]
MNENAAPNYRRAGVDLEAAEEIVRRIGPLAAGTRTGGVQSEIGGFGGFFAFPHPESSDLLVASIDGVGTKMKVARQTGQWRSAGYDIVAHCVDDILTHGARPLFFLDYLGVGRLEVDAATSLLEGVAEGCREAGCALLGGETAEMPGVYVPGEVDLVGCIIGTVRREAVLPGDRVRAGDRLIGLASWGLHTNGYSLARRVLIDAGPGVATRLPESGRSLGEALSARHRMYWRAVEPLLGDAGLHGMAHITGGGIPGNLVRVLPAGLEARIDRQCWEIPEIFREIQRRGEISDAEMRAVFNMGIGWILIVAPEVAEAWQARLAAQGWGAAALGELVEGPGGVVWVDARP